MHSCCENQRFSEHRENLQIFPMQSPFASDFVITIARRKGTDYAVNTAVISTIFINNDGKAKPT